MGTLMLNLLQNGATVVQEVPVQTPGENEILVRVKAVAINPTDWKRLLFSLPIGQKFTRPLVVQMQGYSRKLGLTLVPTLQERLSKLDRTSRPTSRLVIRSLHLFVEGYLESEEHSRSTLRHSLILRS